MMDSPQQNLTSTPKYVPPQRRPTYNGQLYLTYEDLHTRYSPFNSSRLRISQVQRSLSVEGLYQRFQENQSERQLTNQESQGQESHDSLAFSPPPPLRDLEAVKTYRPLKTHEPKAHGPSLSPSSRSEQSIRPILSPKLPDSPVFNDTDRFKFED